MSGYGGSIFPQHAKLLAESAIGPDVAKARGYVSVDTKTRLAPIKIVKAGRNVPGLLIPIHGVDGTLKTYQYRPDSPRLDKDGKPVKYETPHGSRAYIDVPPAVREHLGDPSVPLWITEGSRKADAAVSAGLCCVALMGVWMWRGKNERGGKTALPCWDSIALNDREVYIAFDSDVVTKDSVRDAMDRLSAFLRSRGARVRIIRLPGGEDGGKVGLDDFLAAGGTVEQLYRLASDARDIREPDPASKPKEPAAPPPTPVPLDQALKVFKSWLHLDDDAPVLAVAATVVANNAEGDPAWLLLVGPPSSGKTETLQATAGLPYVHPVATVTESALLSGVSKRDRAKDATGGLLRQVGDYGIILCKDFTSVLSQNKDVSAAALAALREVYDGSWARPVGADGGRILSWSGKCGLIGGVTPTIDRYAQVVGALGDRYILLRFPDVDPAAMARSALAQGGNQRQMRAELAEAMTGLIAGADLSKVTRPLAEDEVQRLVNLATFTARARTAVERDGYSREVTVLPQPEGTGRLVGQFRRLLGGLEAIGCDPATAWDVLYRVALDCIPRLRMRVLETLMRAREYTVGLGGDHPLEELTTGRVANVVGVDWRTANRHLEDLRLLDLAWREIEEKENGEKPTYWHQASHWLRQHWPKGPDEKYYYARTGTQVPHQNPSSEGGTDGGPDPGTPLGPHAPGPHPQEPIEGVPGTPPGGPDPRTPSGTPQTPSSRGMDSGGTATHPEGFRTSRQDPGGFTPPTPHLPSNGSCQRCRKPCRRYGEGGNPLCDECRKATP